MIRMQTTPATDGQAVRRQRIRVAGYLTVGNAADTAPAGPLTVVAAAANVLAETEAASPKA